MKKVIALFAFMLLGASLFSQTKWVVDNVHSSVKFTVTHLVISEVEGYFKSYNGTVMAKKPDFAGSSIDFTVDVNSISTDNDTRDKHLKSADFFEVEKYPQMTFKSTSFRKISGNKYQLNGNLTIHGITKPVKFDVTYGGTAKDGYGNIKAGFKAVSKVNRFDYGLKWNALTEAGGATVGKTVTIELRMEFAKSK
ncbi:MAG: YceI family protein [Bacteroidota bacterium]|nr:YceI family protein [Bacteroidota bacterium]MDP4225682.1 YceI family protein [Bacteroidota bacterium]MDP4274546.1 YceI family protein [Bacteroidota bacterium]